MQRDREFQELMEVAQQQGKVHQEMQLLEKEVEKRDNDIQQLQKQLKEAEHILVGAAGTCFTSRVHLYFIMFIITLLPSEYDRRTDVLC